MMESLNQMKSERQMEGGGDLDLCTDGVFDFVKNFIIY